MTKAELWLWLHKTFDYQLTVMYKDTEGPTTIVCGINESVKCFLRDRH